MTDYITHDFDGIEHIEHNTPMTHPQLIAELERIVSAMEARYEK